MKELSVEELEKIAGDDSSPDVEFKAPSDNLMRFIKGFGIEDGPAPIATFIIYYYYATKWEPTGQKLSYIEFFRQFNKVYRARKSDKTRYYMLQKGRFNVGKETVDDARQYQKEQAEKSKSKDKVSGS